MIKRLARWLDARLGLASFARQGLDHIFPDHWSFMLGEIALYCFVVLVLTGIFLALFFNASGAEVSYDGPYLALQGVPMTAAYRSALYLSFEIPAGLFMRQIHHWAALVFIAAILGHLMRIFLTGAFRCPREINWVVGATLLVLASLNGFAGYSLPDDLLSGTGLRIAYSIALSTPVIGPWLAFIFFGGQVPTGVLIPRLYGLHIVIVPALITALLALHLGIVWRQMHTNYPGPGRSNSTIVGSRLWPTYALKAVGLFFLVFAVLAALGGLLEINPIWIYGPFDFAAILPGAQPDWYLGWAEGALRLFPGVNLHLWGYLVPELFFPGVLLPLILVVALYTYPFLQRWISGDHELHNILQHPSENVARTASGSAVFAFLLVLFFAGGQDVITVISGIPLVYIRSGLRVLVFVLPVVTALFVALLCLWLRKKTLQRKAP
jgi:ubiquinol-cytochrome c reductase cytochrome b subunit